MKTEITLKLDTQPLVQVLEQFEAEVEQARQATSTFAGLLDAIDAYVYSGDTLHDEATRLVFSEFIDGWRRAIDELNKPDETV